MLRRHFPALIPILPPLSGWISSATMKSSTASRALSMASTPPVGSCCLASPTRFMTDTPEAAEYLKRLELPEGYRLLYCIAFGYPDETPAAKPRDAAKVKYVD